MAGGKPGGTALYSPALRRLRVAAIIQRKVYRNMSDQRIADELGIHKATVNSDLKWAERQGILENFEEQILRDIAPLAMKALKRALSQESVDAGDKAVEVLKGIGILRKQSDKPLDRPAPEVQEESLEIYVKKVRGTDDTKTISSTGEADFVSRRLLEMSTGSPAPLEAELVENSDEDSSENPGQQLGVSDEP